MSDRSKDYHDYVFRNGQLVGEFEAMYRHSENVPWHQDEQRDWIDVRLTVEMLRAWRPYTEIHDLGCGLGYYLDLLRTGVGSADCATYGYDISPTACAQAHRLFPHANFQTLDLRTGARAARAAAAPLPGARRLFAIRGTLWYVYARIADVVSTIHLMMADGDQLLVVQNFPPLDAPFIGKDVIPDDGALLRHFARRFTPLRHLWYQDEQRAANDNWFIGLFSPRQH